MPTLTPALARAASISHSRSSSTPPTAPRVASPAPTSPISSSQLREQVELQQKDRDRSLWESRWQQYEDRKAAWLQASWAEYEKRKASDTTLRWKEYDATKKDMMAKWADMELKGKRTKGAFPPVTQEEVKAWTSHSSSSRSHPNEHASSKTVPVAPTPLKAPAFIHPATTAPLSRTRSTRVTPSSTPPPMYHSSPPATPISPYSATSTPPRTPTRAAAAATMHRSNSQRSTPSPAPTLFTPAYHTPRSATPNLYFPPPPSPLFSSSSAPYQHARSRSNTNPTAVKPQIFMPKPMHASDSDAPNKADQLLAEEKHRRAADETRRREIAAENARRKQAEQLEAERKAQKARLNAANTPKREASQRKSTEETPRRSVDQAEALQRAALEQQHRLVHAAWEAYEERWKSMYGGFYPPAGSRMGLGDIPWPVVGEIRSVGELDRGRLEGFLLWDGPDGTGRSKAMKQRVRDAMLRFHPDRFEGRWMACVRESDRAAVKEGVGRVVRFLNEFSTRLG